MSDMSVFDEFNDRQLTNKQAQEAKTVPSRIAKLSAQGVADESVCEMFGLSVKELAGIRLGADYQEAYTLAVGVEIERPLETDDLWDKIENKALKHVAEMVDHMDSEDAMRYAAMANRATRRTKETTTQDASGGVHIKTVNIAIPAAFAAQLGSMNLQKELGRRVNALQRTKIVDLAKPAQLEALMEERAPQSQDDHDINTIFQGK